MTTPWEEERALKMAERFLLQLTDPKILGITRKDALRKEARTILRHFPTSTRIGLLYKEKQED